MRAELILAECIACNTICATRIRGNAYREVKYQKDASFRRIPAVLNDLNFKFSWGSMPPDPLVCSCFTVQFPLKKGYKQDYRQIASPFIRI